MRDLDLSIIPLFFFAFIAVEGLRSFDLPKIGGIYPGAILISQLISNVPATMLLSPFAANDWKTLLYGVNAGGCGAGRAITCWNGRGCVVGRAICCCICAGSRER